MANNYNSLLDGLSMRKVTRVIKKNPYLRSVLENLASEIIKIREKLDSLTHENHLLRSRGEIENLFSRYHYYHNAFRDDLIKDLWVKKGTSGIRAIYTNTGEYSTYESVMAYHENRPSPKGKLILHMSTTPVIEVAKDGKTAKGVWIMAGTESGLTDPEHAKHMPEFMFSPQVIDGKRVWAHWVWCKYALDFLFQDGVWKILTFRCYELTRAPFEENWISFASKNSEAFALDIKYFGEGGEVHFMPKPDNPVKTEYWPYRNDQSQVLDPFPPLPHESFHDTFR